MLKKIALITIFAIASVVSIGSSSVSAAKPIRVGAPVMNGMCKYFKC